MVDALEMTKVVRLLSFIMKHIIFFVVNMSLD